MESYYSMVSFWSNANRSGKHLTVIMASNTKYLPVLIMAVSFFLAGCSEAPKPMGMPPSAVSIAPVTVAPFKEKSTYLGTLKSRKSVTLSPNVEGNVTQINVMAGDSVEAGQRIMQIDARQQAAATSAGKAGADSVQSDLATAKATLRSLQSTLKSKLANVEYTKTQYDRYVVLQAQGAVSQSELDTRKNSLAAAQAERDATLQDIEAQKSTVHKFEGSHNQAVSSWQAQKEQLKYYSIVAPFSGTVGDIPVKIGDHVDSATKLTTLTENHPLEVYVSIPAEKASFMKEGMRIDLLSTDGKNYGNSQVIFISPIVDASSQTVLVKALYPNVDSLLRADQTVQAQILWHTGEGISVPTKAVTQIAGKYFVFVAKKDAGKLVARQVEIEVIGIEGDSYQVKSGLQPSDRIIVSGIQRLIDGTVIVDKSTMGAETGSIAQKTQRIH